MQAFLESITYILTISNEKERQASLRGENYNIFEVVGITSKEVKLHSAFIADLLNPKGKHGLGIKPLKAFCGLLDLQFSDSDLEKAHITPEYHIGNISADMCSGGNIDILIVINSYYLVIENKIYADDQNKQLLRYKNFLKHKPHTLIYLTLDGHEPSEESACGLCFGDDFIGISYAVDILKWMQELLVFSINRPLIRETIQQYIKVIKKLTNRDMEEIDRAQLFNTMDKYPSAVKEVIESQWYYRLHIVEKYIVDPLKVHFEQLGFKWYEEDDFRSQAKGSGFGIYKPGWVKKICIEFEKYDFSAGFYGVWDPENRNSNMPVLLGNKNSSSWPYGWENLGAYSSWSLHIADDIISGKVFRYVAEKFENLYNQLNEHPEYKMN